MTNTKKLNKPVLISFKIEQDQLNLLKENGITNRSVFFRDCVYNYNKNHNNNLNELKNELKELKQQRNLINNEIEIIQKQINKIENKEQANKKNKELINNIMENIRTIANNENGITRQRIKFICNNKIDSNYIINECRKQNIKIILENQKQTAKNGTAININSYEKKEHNKKPMELILTLFNRSFKGQKTYKDKLNYLKHNKDHYIKLCRSKDINYKDFEKRIKKQYEKEKEKK